MVRAPAGAVSWPLVPDRGSDSREGHRRPLSGMVASREPSCPRAYEVGGGELLGSSPTSSPALPTKKCLPGPNGDNPTCRCSSSENHNY